MKTNLPKYDPIAEAKKVSGTLGESALYRLMKLVEAGDMEAIRLVLENPSLKNKKLADIYLYEAHRILSGEAGEKK